MIPRRLLVLLVAASLGTGGLLGAPAAAVSIVAGPEVTVDTSLGNEIATGAVSDPDPAHARVTVSNRYHFWAGLDLQAPTGGARLTPTALGEDARGLYGMLGLIGPEATSAWAGTFDPAGGSQAVWVHYDLATPRGAQALALTCLTIVADTFGSPLLAPSASAVQHAVRLITDLGKFTDLLSAVQRNDPWEIAKAWSLLLQSQAGRDAIRLALAELGVIVTDGALKTLGSVVGLIDFARTLLDLLRAGLGGHTSGLVTFGVAGETGGPTPGASPTATPAAASPTSTPMSTPSSRTYTGTFSPTGSMVVARSNPFATLLADGRVLVAGGFDANGSLASAELYDPRTGTFSPTGSMTVARDSPSVTLLADGRVLVVGGWDYGTFSGASAGAELYDPRTGTFSRTGSMTVGRGWSSAALLADGRVLVVGGFDASDKPVTRAELYDPRTGTFSRTGSMTAARSGSSAALLADGRVLIVGGFDASDKPVIRAELYDPRTGTFSRTGSMTVGRGWSSATLLPSGRVLVVGGHDPNNNPIPTAELYDPRTGAFSRPGSMARAQATDATLLADGRVLVLGGRDDSGVTAELYDPRTGTFSPTGSPTVARGWPTATLLADGRVLILGGRDSSGNPIASAELFQ